ncbi:MAG TPA: prolyl oligopeptidase family serine peptidase [Ktedonobacteraceae bacterium]|nr:prolyl oligopeptidase family serine peptidase [Ktedonobacteraceae bacterium]
MNKIPARRDTVIENYHGTPVADPYRWLEDAGSPETLAWVEAQNRVTEGYLAAIPARSKIQQRLTELWNYPKYSVPIKKAERYFFSKNAGLQNQSVLYMQPALESEPVAILDPNTFSEDGTVALTNQVFSEDGTLLAYGVSSGGSDWQEIKIRQVDSGADYPEAIRWCRFSSIAWRHDNAGFYYNRLPEPGTVPAEDSSNYSSVWWHTPGTAQSQDTLIYERPDAKELSFSPFITDDGTYLMLHVWHGTDPENRVYYRKVASDEPFIRLLDEADASYDFLGNTGTLFYFQTNLDAPRGRIIAIDSERPERENWQELVPQQADAIAFALVVNDQFVVTYLHDAHHQMKIFNLDGTYVRDIPLPALGSIFGVSGRPHDTEMFLDFSSFLYASSIFRYDFTTGALSLWHGADLKFDASGYETTQVFYPSKDGTSIPMFLTHKKGLTLDGNNPVWLYGYGGFNVSLTPTFAVSTLVWLENGGVYAVANLRGGGEYGEEWHQADVRERKQNVFDDFIAAAEWLIANKYTSIQRLAINGGSNGGLLVAACEVQRPDLYGAVVCQVPVIDMLRYHKFTVGRYWISDYGNAEASAEDFKFLYAYSPLHNVRAGISYPPTLILAADTDDRVVPAHAKKFAATLQAANTGHNPILLHIEMKAGHGLGKPTTKVIEERSDILAFLFHVFGMEFKGG